MIMLTEWEKRFGLENCLYVDLSNEFPYFLDDYLTKSFKNFGPRWSPEWNSGIREEVDTCLRMLRGAFPGLRFTVSLHGDIRWIELDLELDVMDIHFYADADKRFNDRTRFDNNVSDFLRDESLFSDFSQRCIKSRKGIHNYSIWDHETIIYF